MAVEPLGYIQPDYGVGEPDNPSGIKFEAMNALLLRWRRGSPRQWARTLS
jgi:hypothetical protein